MPQEHQDRWEATDGRRIFDEFTEQFTQIKELRRTCFFKNFV